MAAPPGRPAKRRKSDVTSIRGGSGLGDAIYVQSIARHLADRGHAVEACSDYPDVFRPLAGRVAVSPFRRDRIDRLAHYAGRRERRETTQFEDCCIQAGIREPVRLDLGWSETDVALTARLRARGRPIVVVAMPRAPFGDRPDRYGIELLPDFAVMQRAIDMLAGEACIVQVGAGRRLHGFANIGVDLAGQTSVGQLLDVVSAADAVIGYVSFLIPLAEALGKPALFVWSRRGLRATDRLISTITPEKILTRSSLTRPSQDGAREPSRHGRPAARRHCQAVIDDCDNLELQNGIDALRRSFGRPVAA